MKNETRTMNPRWFPFGLAPGDVAIRDYELHTGQIMTAGLLTEALRFLWSFYSEKEPAALTKAMTHASSQLGDSNQEMVLLRLSVENPAMGPLSEFFGNEALAREFPFDTLVSLIEEHLDQCPTVPTLGLSLMDALRAPMRAHPDSLDDQLAYVRENWAALLPADLLARLVLAADILAEKQRHRGHGPGPSEVMEFGTRGESGDPAADSEEERFSADADWMSNVVLLAKSTYVWLDQLSKRYRRQIARLDQIPDEELDMLARWGFTGLWLIGLWERSAASKKMKRAMGNPEAEASAYSLWDYEIAQDLGGDAAYHDLKRRAGDRGIRLAADMVPNHTGLDSRWMTEHPERFLQLDQAPYPGYGFSCEDLCDHPDVTVQIEDGYWDKRDAAVVFKHTDHRSGRVRYVYHGNDGTSMPWNDTAQLDFLRPDTREEVIQRILHVARRFPVIRFDAAMTLAKKHIQRLWYPRPGDAGAIPSRAEHGMSKSGFDGHVPVEFWREVVDRVAAEAPDTLLLAEAFWMMEGYFVRTLGMHRVYNSAFMNMLKMEENSKYRSTLRNVLEFSPEVLKRFVNFMNNPDERTAEEQFGKGDKYFGCALLMVTLPGLPMWGHGQTEGFTEKYGMEYRRAYRDEEVDQDLVRRHEAEIFPLMRLRHLFSGAEHFALFDFVRGDGAVDENVFAYTNRAGDDRALILYNNAYESSSGTVHTSCAVNTAKGDAQFLVRRSLVEALALPTGDADMVTFRDHRTGLHYLRSCHSLAAEGFHAMLGGYQYHAFLDFRLIHDGDGEWRGMEAHLNGAGVPDLGLALEELRLEPLLEAVRTLLDAAPAEKKVYLAATILSALDEDGTAQAVLLERVLRDALGAPAADTALALCAERESLPKAFLDAPAARRLLRIHEHEGIEWFDQEALEALATAWFGYGEFIAEEPAEGLDAKTIIELATVADYRVDRFRKLLLDLDELGENNAPL